MRSWFRHEQQSIRMALATVLHHSYDRVHTEYDAPRSQNTATRARGGGESDETKYTAKIRKTPLSRRSSGCTTRKTPCGWLRPLSITDPVPQDQVGRHTVEHRIEVCPFVQILDALVPQMGDQVLGLLQKIVTASLVEPVQVIAVPKISLDRIHQRSAARRTQMAEQLVEVPSEPGYALAVIGTKPWGKRQQRHWPSRSLTFQFFVAGGRGVEVFKVLVQDRVQQHRMWSRTLTSSSSWSWWSGWSSRFPPWTGFNSVLWSRSRRESGSVCWRSSWLSARTSFFCLILALTWCRG